jgi:hypothetical protein
LHAADQVLAERAELEKLWAQKLQRADIAADRARRCYHLAEPENRLVVRQLEKEWENALATQQRLREEHDRFTRTNPRTLTAAERQTITALASDLHRLWDAETTTAADRKQIVRAIVDKVEITVLGASERVQVTIVWAGGAATAGHIVRPLARLDQLSYYPQMTERICDLAGQGQRATAIARHLQAEGFRPAKGGKQITAGTVRELMARFGCPAAPARGRRCLPPGEELGPEEWWLDQLAAELDMPKATLHTWIGCGWVHVRRESRHPYRLIAHAGQRELAELRERRSRPPGWYARRRWNEPHESVTEQEPAMNPHPPVHCG